MYLRRLYVHPLFVFYTIISLPFLQQQNLHNDCSQRGITLTCYRDIPDRIPNGVKEVFILNTDLSIMQQKYRDKSWKFVTKLDITLNPENEHRWIKDNSFLGLTNLKSLGIHGKNIYGINSTGLAGLENLSHLDLAECEELNNVVPSLTTENALPNLKSLNLRGVHSNAGRYFVLSAEFLNMLQTKSITKLSLSGTNIMINNASLFNRKYSLKYLDISNITFVINPPYPPSQNTRSIVQSSFFENIVTLNISNPPRRLIHLEYSMQNKIATEIDCDDYTHYTNVENIYANDIYDKELIINNYSLRVPGCGLKFKTFHFRRNNIRKLNATVYWPTPSLTEIDLSSNGMSYLSPKAFEGCHGLKYLYLQYNNLSQMETFPEFVDLLKTFSQLEHLSMAYNKLTFIPYKMFRNNTQLKILDLMGNELKSVMFHLEHLVTLKTLDLRLNKILYLDGDGLLQLQNLITVLKYDEKNEFDVNFDGNPLECSCKSLDFIKWLETYNQPQVHNVYKCTLEGNTYDIDATAVEKSNYLCHKAGIIAASSVASFLVMAIIVVIVVKGIYIGRKKKYDNGIEKFLDYFKQGKLKQKHLVLLSHSSDDEDLVKMNVYQQLDNNLRKLAPGINNDIICLGDIHFQPGAPLLNEIMRCVEESCVVLFLISRAFCTSAYCRMELEEAYQQEKPIILMFKEHVEQTIMPLYLKNIFQRLTRVKLVQMNGQYEPESGWQRVSESIIELASRTQEQNIGVDMA